MISRSHIIRPFLALPVCLAAAFAGGCVSAKDADKPASGKQNDEYVYITDTGSHIPRRVKRSDLGSTGTATGASTVSGDEARERINHQPLPPRPNN